MTLLNSVNLSLCNAGVLSPRGLDLLCTRCYDNQARERFSLAYIPTNERPLKFTPRGVNSTIASKFTLTTFDSSIFFVNAY